MNIYVDADACPVTQIIIEEATQRNIPVIMVKSYAHFTKQEDPSGVQTVYVDTGADSVDYKIIQQAQASDIIVTQDYGLAALGLSKGCTVLHHKGFAYSQENIQHLLYTRHDQAKLRRSGQKTKGPKPLTADERKRFKDLLQEILPF